MRNTLVIMFIVSITFLASASIANAQIKLPKLVPCGIEKYKSGEVYVDPAGKSVSGVDATGIVKAENKCNFAYFFLLIKNLINWMIIITIPVATLMFGYAGFLFMTAMGNTGQLEKAKGIFTTIVYGVVIMLSAWLVVYTIVSTLAKSEYSQFLLK